jgi:deoxyribodipyrimidine photolyase-related protein
LNLILGDALYRGLPGMPPSNSDVVWMREDPWLARRILHHRQKLVLCFSAMRHFAAQLQAEGRTVRYTRLRDDGLTLPDALAVEISRMRVKRVRTYEPNDPFILGPLVAAVARAGAELEILPNPGFLTTAGDWSKFKATTNRRRMADFYAWQRRRLGILLTPEGGPVGGQWSFDQENRKPLPRSLEVPPVSWVEPDATTQEVIDLVAEEFGNHPGEVAGFGWPVTHAQAETWLNRFVTERLPQFGPYEDAMSSRSDTVFHGLLTPMLNLGLLTPDQVIQAAMARPDIPLPSLEGFLRQVIGWREFVKGMDREAANPPNYFQFQRCLSPAWYQATTGLPPLDDAIRQVLKRGYCHHIVRLMVLGSAMLLCEVQPQEAHKWFMELFIDSADWVMGPNVYGMSQFAEGPSGFATKPYISGSAYLLKMSDYLRGPWCEVWDGLYWRFLERNRSKLQPIPRMQTALLGIDRLKPTRKRQIFEAAESFIDRVTRLPN